MPYKKLIESPEMAKSLVTHYEPASASAQLSHGGIHPVPQLQRTLGNRNVAQLIQARRLTSEGKIIGFQRKLTVGVADDQYEQEADRVARQVMNTPDAAVAPHSMLRAMSPEEDKDKMLQTKPLAAFITPFMRRDVVNNKKPEDKDKTGQAKFLSETSRAPLQRQPEEDKGKTVQAKSAESMSGSFEAGGDVETQVSRSKGRGSPLPEPVRTYMEPRFGVDFNHVRVHTGSGAMQMSRNVGAQAFTHGSDIYYGEGRSPDNLELTAHELTHVVQQMGGAPALTFPNAPLKTTATPNWGMQRRVLTAAEETAAISSGRGLFNSLTLRVLQTITGVPAADRDGVIGPQTVRAISDWQTARGLTDTGIVDLASMNRLVTESLAASRAEHGIQLVLDFFNLNTSTDTLTVRHRTGAFTFEGIVFRGLIPIPNFSPGSTTFEEGNLRVIEVGDPAFVSATTLRDTIQRELARAAPASGPAAAVPARLNAAQVRNAVRYTASKYSDERSVRAIQGLVGAPVTGTVDATTVQFIAEAQHAGGIGIDGMVGIITTENFYTRMIARGNPNSALRLLVDFFDMKDQGNLLSVYFDPTVAALASTDFRPSEPVRVRVGPNALTLPFSGAVHNIAHELEHVRRLREGIVSARTHEFLGEALEILSVGMPEEPLDPVNPSHDAFIDDATRCLNNWNLMPIADRRTFRGKFIAVRRKVLQRIDAGTAAQRAANAALRGSYVAVVLP